MSSLFSIDSLVALLAAAGLRVGSERERGCLIEIRRLGVTAIDIEAEPKTAVGNHNRDSQLILATAP